MELFKSGDKVEIIGITPVDYECNVKISDIAKVIGVYELEQGWYFCTNPNWKVDKLIMKYTQLKKL